MTFPTRVRAARASALFIALQSAPGVPVTDFTGSNAVAVSAADAEAMIAPVIPSPQTMDIPGGPSNPAEYLKPIVVEGMIPIYATKPCLELLLKNNYGTVAAGVYTLAAGISDTRWMTIAWIEHVSDTNYRAIILSDVWVHKLELEMAGPRSGPILARAHYAGVLSSIPLISGAGLTLPAAPMLPANKAIFPAPLATLVRDPAGLATSYRLRTFSLTFDQGLGRKWVQDALQFLIFKKGKLKASLDASVEWSDESWAILDDARVKQGRRFRLTLTAEDASVLTCDLYNMTTDDEPLRRRGLEVDSFRFSGDAMSDGTNFIHLTLN